jgi:curli biogenesis system outer membrane secretion channel CsgG
MKRFIAFALFVAIVGCLAGVPNSEAAGKKIRVAVFDFQNNSTWSWWGDKLGEAANDEFVTQLVNTGQFTVIERQKIQAILAEQGLGASGAVTASTAPKIGKLLGVQIIFTGSITAFSIKTTRAGFGGIGGSFTKAESKLDVRMIDTTTGEILLVASGAGDKKMGGAMVEGANFQQNYDEGVASEALRPAIEKVTQQVVAKAGTLSNLAPASGSGKVVDVDAKMVYIDGGEEGGVNVGDRYVLYRVSKEIKDEDGNVLDTITDKVGEVVVTKVNPHSAVCQLSSGTAKKGDSYRKE